MFPSNFDVMVGFGYHSFMKKLKSRMSLVLGKSKAKLNLKQIKNDRSTQFPVTLKPGFAVGMFEALFGLPSRFIYKLIPLAEAEHTNIVLKGFFLRLKNWRIIDEKMSHLKDWPAIRDAFKDNVFVNFFEKAYVPIKEEQHT